MAVVLRQPGNRFFNGIDRHTFTLTGDFGRTQPRREIAPEVKIGCRLVRGPKPSSLRRAKPIQTIGDSHRADGPPASPRPNGFRHKGSSISISPKDVPGTLSSSRLVPRIEYRHLQPNKMFYIPRDKDKIMGKSSRGEQRIDRGQRPALFEQRRDELRPSRGNLLVDGQNASGEPRRQIRSRTIG